MKNTVRQQRILQRLQEHFEKGRLGLRDLTERLQADELRLLRQHSGGPLPAWSAATFERMIALVELGDSRQLVRRRDESERAEDLAALARRVLLIGFAPPERRRLSLLLEAAPDGAFAVRSVGSIEEAEALLAQTTFDAALLERMPDAGSSAHQLARAEAVAGETPILLLLDRDEEPQLADLGARTLVKAELDAKLLADAVQGTIAHRRAALALASSHDGHPPAAALDTVTGLANRASFVAQLWSALEYAERHGQEVCVLVLDIDRFGAIDRALGREVADGLLITAAERMRGALRKSDLIARATADEFWMLLRGHDLGDAATLAAERLLECLARPFVVDGTEHRATASLGIASHPRDGRDPDALLRAAEAALGRARAEGGNRYRHHGLGPQQGGVRRERLSQRLTGALARGDLTLCYQPRVDARSGAIVAVESLLRWNDAELGAVSPAEFVPVSERSGLMEEIGAWVMRESCLAHRRWSEAGFPSLRLAVNVSTVQLQSASLRDDVVDAMMNAGLAPTLLEVELTENALAASQNTATLLLRELAEIGVALSLDDFGTGHAALSCLRTYPVRTLKIDPSFVHELTPERASAPLIDTILALARTLGLAVVAEGVETALQRDGLLERGCWEMQGFWFSRAVGEQDLLDLLRAGPLGTGV